MCLHGGGEYTMYVIGVIKVLTRQAELMAK